MSTAACSGALRADARDEKAAEQLRDVVRGALAAGRLMAGQNKQMDAMLNSLQITGSGKTVGLTFTLPAGLLDVLKGLPPRKAASERVGVDAAPDQEVTHRRAALTRRRADVRRRVRCTWHALQRTPGS